MAPSDSLGHIGIGDGGSGIDPHFQKWGALISQSPEGRMINIPLFHAGSRGKFTNLVYNITTNCTYFQVKFQNFWLSPQTSILGI